jgi:hypothetical protein
MSSPYRARDDLPTLDAIRFLPGARVRYAREAVSFASIASLNRLSLRVLAQVGLPAALMIAAWVGTTTGCASSNGARGAQPARGGAASAGRGGGDETADTVHDRLRGLAKPRFGPARGEPASPGRATAGTAYLPLERANERYYGETPAGHLGIADGVRTLTSSEGALQVAAQRLPQGTLSAVHAVAERLGGGYLFLIGSTVHRSDSWLGPTTPLMSVTGSGHTFIEGFDRLYLASSSLPMRAFDPRSGAPLPLGALPPSPAIGNLVSFDAWNAVALADGLGAVISHDAGASWKALELPLANVALTGLQRDGQKAVLSGFEAGRGSVTFEVDSRGDVSRSPGIVARGLERDGARPMTPEVTKLFGRPQTLVAALLDGYPLEDGSALFARDGALLHVRMTDGAILHEAKHAFAMRQASCHPVVLGAWGANTRAADGSSTLVFVCGEHQGATALLRYDDGALTEMVRFADPRAVLGGLGGGLAVRGGCGAVSGSLRKYCVLRPDGQAREIDVNGDVDHPRFVPMSDGALAVVSPPHGKLQHARVTILAEGKAKTIPINFARLRSDVFRALEDGMWLDGFEERSAGTLGGWIEHRGLYLGMSINLATGEAKVGDPQRDSGIMTVAGRYAMFWGAQGRSQESQDGGLTWNHVEGPALPPPMGLVALKASGGVRAVGPLGAVGSHWARIGWGTGEPTPPALPLTAPTLKPQPAETLTLQCREVRKLTSGDGADGKSFYGTPAFKARTGEVVVQHDVFDATDRYSRREPLARIAAWGPKSGEWDLGSAGVIRWLSSWSSAAAPLQTRVASLPKALRDTLRPTGGSFSSRFSWPYSVAFSSDGAHALLGARVNVANRAELLLYDLEAGGTPSEIRRVDGDPIGELEATTWVGGQWYFAAAGPAETTVYVSEGTTARVFATLPRGSGSGGQRASLRLGYSPDEARVAVVLDGPANGTGARYVYPFLRATGEALAPERLDTSALRACPSERGSGYVIEYPNTASVRLEGEGQEQVATVYSSRIRVRAGNGGSCLLGISGVLSADTDKFKTSPALPVADPKVGATFVNGDARHSLSCVVR